MTTLSSLSLDTHTTGMTHLKDTITIDFSKAFDLVPHGQLFTKTANSGLDSRVVVWIREFLLGRT